MAVLVYLANRSGDVVGAEELLASVWPDTITSDAAIYQRIALLRRTLGDDSHKPRYIETVPKRGYRLVADVGDPLHVDPTPNARLAWMPSGRWLTALAVVVSISGIGYFNLNLQEVSGGEAQATYPSLPGSDLPPLYRYVRSWADSIAVVPLKTAGNPSATDPSVVNQSDEIHQALAKYTTVKKLSRASWNGYRDALPNMLVNELGVAYVVDGTLRVVEGGVRITIHLVQADDGMQVWSREFQRPDDDLDTQAQLARHMAQTIDQAIAHRHLLATVQSQTRNPAAYEYLHKAEFGIQSPFGNNWGLGMDNLRKAIELDPAYGWAYLFLAKRHSFDPGIAHYERDARTARAMALKARELMPNEPEVYWTLGMIDLFLYLDYAAAEENAHQCLSFEPNSGSCHRLLGLSRIRRGDADGALWPFARALETSDTLLNFRLFATALIATGDHQRALDVLDRGLAIAPIAKLARITGSSSALEAKNVLFIQKANLLAQMGEFEALNEVIEVGLRDYPALSFIHHLAKVGREPEARRLLSERLGDSTKRWSANGTFWAYVGFGELDAAFPWLMKSIEERAWMDTMLNNIRLPGFFTEIRTHPRFGEALELVGEIERAARAAKAADELTTS